LLNKVSQLQITNSYGKKESYRAYMTDLGLTDPEILRSIEIHTVGSHEMSTLDKIVYVADYIEPSRPALPYIDEMRACAFTNLHKAALYELKSVIAKIKEDNGVMDKRTEETYEYYKKLVEG